MIEARQEQRLGVPDQADAQPPAGLTEEERESAWWAKQLGVELDRMMEALRRDPLSDARASASVKEVTEAPLGRFEPRSDDVPAKRVRLAPAIPEDAISRDANRAAAPVTPLRLWEPDVLPIVGTSAAPEPRLNSAAGPVANDSQPGRRLPLLLAAPRSFAHQFDELCYSTAAPYPVLRRALVFLVPCLLAAAVAWLLATAGPAL